jgi:beta-glucosidase
MLLMAVVSFGQTPPAATESESKSMPAPAAAAPSPPRVNTAIVPQLNRGFMSRHNENVEVAKKGDIDLLFMGDSITDWWRSNGRGGATGDAAPYAGKPVFDKYFGSLKAANFGIAGDTTQGVLWRLQNGEGEGFKPKAVMLMIGTNNTGKNTPPEIAMGVAAVIGELRKDFPDAKILLLGVFPRGRPDAPVRAQIAEINRIISTLHDNQHVIYLDIGPKFLADDGSIPKDVMSDGLHPTTKGYEIWAQAVQESLESFLK